MSSVDQLKYEYYQRLATDFQVYEMTCDLQQVYVTAPVTPPEPMDICVEDVDISIDSDLVI